MRAHHRLRSDDRQDGFTLIELLVVIVIIGILAAIAIPTFINQRQKGYDAQAKSDLRNMANAEETYLTDYFAYTGDVNALVTEGFKKSANVDAHAATATADTGYVLTACSQSGKKWQYSSNGNAIVSVGSCTF